MTATNHTEKWPAVTRHAPCAICEKPDWCVVSPDGAIAGCMRQQGDKYFKTTPNGMHLHRQTDEPRERPTPRPQPTTTTRDVMADRAVFGSVARSCAALPPVARDELARRFGPVYGPQAAARFGIGYIDGPALLAALAAAGRTQDAQKAAVLWRDGTVARTIEGKLIIPHRRDGLVHDLRIAGIKAIHEETKEISLPGGYAEREIADLFLNHDALNGPGPDGVIHMGGGSWKTIALVLADLPAIGTRGEAELSGGQIAALQASGIRTIVLHIDAEDPQAGEDRSAGRRLGLQKAEKLAAAGFDVRIAEPPREPGTPKVDPDALLRDLGPRAVRDYALSAIPLDAWRVVIGEAAPGVPEQAALIARIEAELAEERRRREIEQAEGARMVLRITELETENAALEAGIKHPDQAAGVGAFDLIEAAERARKQGDILTRDGKDYARVPFKQAVNRRSQTTLARGFKSMHEAGKLDAFTRTERIETATFKGEVPIAYIHIPPRAAWPPGRGGAGRPAGGGREEARRPPHDRRPARGRRPAAPGQARARARHPLVRRSEQREDRHRQACGARHGLLDGAGRAAHGRRDRGAARPGRVPARPRETVAADAADAADAPRPGTVSR
jgi:hypothetical protein